MEEEKELGGYPPRPAVPCNFSTAVAPLSTADSSTPMGRVESSRTWSSSYRYLATQRARSFPTEVARNVVSVLRTRATGVVRKRMNRSGRGRLEAVSLPSNAASHRSIFRASENATRHRNRVRAPALPSFSARAVADTNRSVYLLPLLHSFPSLNVDLARLRIYYATAEDTGYGAMRQQRRRTCYNDFADSAAV